MPLWQDTWSDDESQLDEDERSDADSEISSALELEPDF